MLVPAFSFAGQIQNTAPVGSWTPPALSPEPIDQLRRPVRIGDSDVEIPMRRRTGLLFGAHRGIAAAQLERCVELARTYRRVNRVSPEQRGVKAFGTALVCGCQLNPSESARRVSLYLWHMRIITHRRILVIGGSIDGGR